MSIKERATYALRELFGKGYRVLAVLAILKMGAYAGLLMLWVVFGRFIIGGDPPTSVPPVWAWVLIPLSAGFALMLLFGVLCNPPPKNTQAR